MVSNLTYVCDFVHESITKIVAILHEVVLKYSTTIIGNFNTMKNIPAGPEILVMKSYPS